MNSSKVRVLVVDDSAYNRRTIIKMLETVPNIEVVAYACDGEEALRKVFDLKPDLVTLDLEMPRMDGFSFLRICMQHCPTPVIVISSRADDENVFKALEFGAVDFVAKPAGRVSPELSTIEEDLLRKVREIAGTDMSKVVGRPGTMPPRSPSTPRSVQKRVDDAGGIECVVIASSTGGPPALQAIFTCIQQPIPVAFGISQHMPPGFTRAFADRLNKFCALEVTEAQSGDVLRPGRVLIAPGGRNLLFRRWGNDIVAHVVEPPSDQRYVPSADAMFNSAADLFGPSLLGVVLTGMGNDGARGVERIKERGGQVLAEAEESSVVFGMPKEAIATGTVDRIVPLPGMGREILRRCGF